MIIGVDFDNTIVCYDGVFHRAAIDKGWFEPSEKTLTKDEVRNDLRRRGMEEEWIHLQGYVYGARMRDALPYPGASEFFTRCKRASQPIVIVSQRTRRPFRGPEYDLHASAQDWLEYNGFYDPAKVGLSRECVHLAETKPEKMAKIAELGCAYFIDDLPELLGDPDFPASTTRILYDPAGAHPKNPRFQKAASWSEIEALLAAFQK
ncbi:MAG: haloacid dehalogenase-like hydrolase [Elusimicrobia bacterium]|nr:haloacid dehalogenase-like hydrolase [Elusimicrobiota bacterium]